MKNPSILIVLAGALLLPAGVRGQVTAAPDTAWNSARALELIGRAQQRRTETNADTGLMNYQSDARLRVYFYLDRTDTGERNLVKTDQLALEVLWQAPDLVKQRIVGWRDEKSLPTNIRYHLDHLTVVQENFGDEIRIGDGDEVRGVTHPAAPRAEEVYDFQLADSLTLRLPGATEAVRVYEIRVRPKDPERPAFLGSVFVERRNGDLVRMDFTFTASSYIDRYLDYINISLDNGLWKGRFWLPNQQRVEIRRRIPALDVPAGSVIRANVRVSNYRFNLPLPPATFAGPPVVALPRTQREAFAFEEEIHAEVLEEGIGPQVELREIRRMATELVRQQALARVSDLQLRIPRASELVRYNRAEGAVLAAGVSVVPREGLRLVAHGGWAYGAHHPLATLSLERRSGTLGAQARLYLNQPRDVGVGPAASGALNTVSAFLAGRDYTDLFYTTGGAASLEHAWAPLWSVEGGVRAERQRSATLGSSFSAFGGPRPVLAIDEADRFVGGHAALRRRSRAEAGRWWTAELRADGGMVNPARECPVGSADPCAAGVEAAFLKPQLVAQWGRRWAPRDAELRLAGRGGAALGELPRQELYLLGGRGTLPGYGFRSFGGDRFALAELEASADLRAPWVRGRLLGGVGWAGAGAPGADALARWGARTTGGLLPSVGVGVGLLHDIVRVDVARGLGAGGGWELIVEANPSFWDFL